MSISLSGSLLITGSITTTGGITISGSILSASYSATSSFSNDFTVLGNLTVFGTQSVQYITSSQLNVSDNVITVNVASPGVRFGGLSVFDSGSLSSESTASLFWDSQQNHWIYQRESGSTYNGGMLISGPRNAAGLGNELGTTACMLLVGQGGDHLTSSMIYHGTTCTNFYENSLFISSSGTVLVGSATPTGTEKFGVTKDDGVSNGLHSIVDFNKSAGSSAELILGYLANGSTVTGPVVYSSNGFPLLFSAGTVERMRINSGGCVGIGGTSPCSLLNVHCASSGGDSLYTNLFTLTTDVSNTFNHLAFSPTSIEFRREAQTGVDFCIRTLVCNGSSGGNIVFAPNLDGQSMCSYPRMKIQQNGFIGIGAACAQTYLHVCDNLSAGRDDLIRLQTNISTNHVWLKSISCAGVTSIFGSNRANTDGNLVANHAVAGTTSGHNFDLISNSTVRVRLSSGGAVCLLGNSNDYPSLFLAGPTYTMIGMGDRTSSAGTDTGYISIYNQGGKVIDLPGNADNIYFCTGGRFIIGRSSFCEIFSFANSEICNGQTWLGPLSLGNSGGGVSQAPLYCDGGGKRWAIGWDSGALNALTTYNNCTPILFNWGINGDNASADRKFCFNYSGNAYSTGGTWGTLSSNCVIKTCIIAANSQWNDIKNICIVNYKMKDEIEEFGASAISHLGVIAEQIAEVSPGLLEDGGYNEKWCACLNGVKTSILHMKAVKALQEAMYRIELLESCLGIS
jgi:hypothetical protein